MKKKQTAVNTTRDIVLVVTAEYRSAGCTAVCRQSDLINHGWWAFNCAAERLTPLALTKYRAYRRRSSSAYL